MRREPWNGDEELGDLTPTDALASPSEGSQPTIDEPARWGDALSQSDYRLLKYLDDKGAIKVVDESLRDFLLSAVEANPEYRAGTIANETCPVCKAGPGEEHTGDCHGGYHKRYCVHQIRR